MRRRVAFTLVELLVVIAIIGILIALMLPAVQTIRESSNRSMCQNNLKQLALGMASYHSFNNRLPEGMAGPTASKWGDCFGTWQMLILPYIERNDLFTIYKGYGNRDPGNVVSFYDAVNNPVCQAVIPLMTCPTDLAAAPTASLVHSKHNYAANFGNTATEIASEYAYPPKSTYNSVSYQGAPFRQGKAQRFRDISDGSSNTLLLAEIVKGQGDDNRGVIWWGSATGFHGYLRPNDTNPDRVNGGCNSANALNPPCLQGAPMSLAARSRHRGGVNAALCDGSVQFYSDTIDANNWRALSSSKGSEVLVAE